MNKSMKTSLIFEKAFGFSVQDIRLYTKNIYIVGCGGNGSHLVPHISRLTQKSNNTNIILIDGDKVENKNIIRQNFVENDVGRNKAEVLSSRYSCLNSCISFIPEMFNKEQISSKPYQTTVLVTCTDTFSSRHEVSKVFEETPQCLWIDLGNEKTAGQVIVASTYKRTEREMPLPHVFELFPDTVTQSNSVGVSPSCADLTEQVGFVNLTAATIAANYMWALLTGHPIFSHMTSFSVDNVFETHRITSDKTKEWKKISRFQ